MTETNIITIDNCDKLFEHLDPAKGDWNGWYFRGVHCGPQGEPRALLPSAWRKDNAFFNNFLEKRTETNTLESFNQLQSLQNLGVDPLRIKKLILQLYFENYMLSSFYTNANNIGLKTPADALCHIEQYAPSYWLTAPLTLSDHVINADHFTNYKAGTHLSFEDGIINYNKELPQHYGVPTRLLDFTSDPRKAIFFSFHCNNKECCCNRPEGYSSIYALNPSYSNTAPLNIHITHDRYQNKFLHAQDGIFISIAHANMYFMEHGKWPTLQDACPEAVQEIRYPNSLKNEIYKKLRKCQVSISNLMPSYHSAAEEIKLELSYLI